MAYSYFTQEKYLKTLDTSEVARVGGFTLGADGQMNQLALHIYKQGTAAGTEKVRIKLYHDEDLTKLYATSDYVNLYQISGFTAASAWVGRVPFTFATEPHCEDAQAYFVAVETSGYTRNGDTFYLSFLMDWPEPINVPSAITAGAMEFYPEVRL